MVTLGLLAACWQPGAAAGPLAEAARAGDLAEVREFIAQGAAVNEAQTDGSTALLWAAWQSHPEMVDALLAAGADPDLANDFGVTPLLQAGRYGDAAVIGALLDGGAQVDLASPQGETPLMAAARAGSAEAVSLLLTHGADPNAAEALEGQTALMWATAEGHLEVVDALLEAGADPNRRARVTSLTERSINADFPSGGFTAAMWAARNGEQAILRRLVEGGVDLNLTNGDGATAMMVAIVNDRFDLAAELLALGADPNDGSLYQAVVMHDATTDWRAQDGSRLRPDHPNDLSALDLIEVLLEAGADPNKRFVGQLHNRTMCCDAYANATPFFRAAVAADVAALELLIAYGADLEWSPPELAGAVGPGANAHTGRTALMVAMNGGQGVPMSGGPGDIREGEAPPFREPSNRDPAAAVRLLLEAGADPDAATPEGATALHQAVQGGKLDIIRILAEAGASLDKANGDGLTALALAEDLAAKADSGASGMSGGNRAGPAEAAALLRELRAARGAQAALEDHWTLLDKYCVECHNYDDFSGGLTLEGRNPGAVPGEAEVWEAVIKKLRLGMMPPLDQPRPDPEAAASFVAALEDTLDAAWRDRPYAGATTAHRLNRAEYGNALRDLLGVEMDVMELLPSDGGDFGFDNVASALTTSPMLLERYLTAALRAADLAVGNEEAPVTAAAYKIDPTLTQTRHIDGLPLGTRGGILVRHTFPADGQYVLSGRLLRTVAEGYFGVEGWETPHEFIVLLDGEEVFSVEIGGPEDHDLSKASIVDSFVAIDEKMTSPRIFITAGPHELAFTWKEHTAAAQDVWQPALRETLEAHNPAGMPKLETAYIEGPYDVTGISNTPSRGRLFVCRPEIAAEEAPCAERIVANLARRAFRRPIAREDIAAPMDFYRQEREAGGDFEDGVRAAVARVLVSPWFLFRVEGDDPEAPAGSVHPVSDIELASRLSFFLWSSVPDEELLGLAEAGKLREPGVLEAQVRRMVADARAGALIENFTGQWLQLRNIDNRVIPAILMFPDFDHNLRRGFRRETELLFGHVLRENRSVHELLTADYSFINERLARHYGIPGVYGSRFRKVALEDPNRFGLLGHGSFLSLTSASSRTSPVIRGTFVLANLLNNPPPPAPAVVPALEDSIPTDRPSTVREQLERHRADPACAGCHRNFDPLGLALENFDAVGRWRDATHQGLAVDAAGAYVDGTPVEGPGELREAILAKPEVFAGTVTEKLLIYALGRGLEAADMPVVRGILRSAAEDDYRLMSIILGIVESAPFQMRMKPAHATAMDVVAQTRE